MPRVAREGPNDKSGIDGRLKTSAMTPWRKTRRKGRRKTPGYTFPTPPPLSPASIEAIGRFVRILARCGAKSPDIVRAVRREVACIPPSWAVRAGRVTREMEHAPHTLSRWFSEAAYQDPLGNPRALPFEGPSGSVVALVRSVDPRFDPREVLDYLVRCGAIRRVGRRYVPRRRYLQFRGGGPYYFHALRLLTNMLATLEHNLMVKPHGRGWFAYVVENRQFPVRARAALDKYVARLGKNMLIRLDTYTQRREFSRRPGEPTMGVGVGINLWEENARTSGGQGERGSPVPSGKRKIARRRRS